MFANVLFPINAEAFTYVVPHVMRDKLQIGSRVLAPFLKRKKYGIVISICHTFKMKKKFKLKDIEDIMDDEPLLTDNMLRLINWLKEYYICTAGIALKTSLPRGILEGKKTGKTRITYEYIAPSSKVVALNDEQKSVLREINKADSGVFLIHGVTGSGKTEVYMEAIASLPENREGLVLVPEISLTPQMIERFRKRFGEKVAFFHSGLSTGERISQWFKMRKGKVKVALGVRSAVFAPLQRLGLIVIDEEQETSYKQSDGLRYNARDTALVRAKFEGIKIILGSATPSFESFYHAQKGKFKYLTLNKRFNEKPMPRIEVLDMNKEDKKNAYFSLKLLNIIKTEQEKEKQSLLLLNRRGYSPILMCSDCGHTFKCKQCSITLTYHKDKNFLLCHYCGVAVSIPLSCPDCKSHSITSIGVGTQKIEEELRSIIDEHKIKRMDRDTTSRKLSHYRIVKEMEKGDINLLIGTQMVAKGHDFPSVTLAAVISADIGLNMPDFRAVEKSFHLFTQLAGRAGRGEDQGVVFIQTYNANHYVFKYIKDYNYRGFFQHELALRQELVYPPFGKLIRIIVRFKEEDAGKKDEILTKIFKNVNLKNQKGLEIIGPSSAPLEKVKGYWRMHLLLKSLDSHRLRFKAKEIMGSIMTNRQIKISVDVDPMDML